LLKPSKKKERKKENFLKDPIPHVCPHREGALRQMPSGQGKVWEEDTQSI
jgi:hypothetical protein